jgi:hypothetical protein
MKSLVCTLILSLLAAFAAAEEEATQPEQPAGTQTLDCSTCHVSGEPTAENAELLSCPRPDAEPEAEHHQSEAPDVFILDKLSDIYVPVVFPHKLHAGMTEMGQGCHVCHHRNPPGPILSCDECHGGPSNPENLRQPGLKGAYHRQCLSCHREWTHETDCVICHARKDPNVTFAPPSDTSDIMGMLHPNIEVPDVKVYVAEELEDTPYATFHHKEHVELFGLQCVDCHREESCNNCHDTMARPARVREDPHEDCVLCHQPEVDADCTFCHAEAPKGPFDHETRTGFSLTAFHAELGCRECHEGKTRFAKVEADCTSCHGMDWAPTDFDHARTGVTLDETHIAIDCIGCHNDGIGQPVTCVFCHDDGRTTFDVAETAE